MSHILLSEMDDEIHGGLHARIPDGHKVLLPVKRVGRHDVLLPQAKWNAACFFHH